MEFPPWSSLFIWNLEIGNRTKLLRTFPSTFRNERMERSLSFMPNYVSANYVHGLSLTFFLVFGFVSLLNVLFSNVSLSIALSQALNPNFEPNNQRYFDETINLPRLWTSEKWWTSKFCKDHSISMMFENLKNPKLQNIFNSKNFEIQEIQNLRNSKNSKIHEIQKFNKFSKISTPKIPGPTQTWVWVTSDNSTPVAKFKSHR